MTGQKNGLITRLQEWIGGEFVAFHCLAHKLELALSDAMKHVPGIFSFKCLIEGLYAYFHKSAKNEREVRALSAEIGSHFYKIGKLFDIRWVASSFNCIDSVLKSYPSLVRYFQMQADSSSQCKGFHSKLTSWTTVADFCFVKNVLFPLKQFSLYCQEENSSVMECFARISTMINTISALGEGMGIALSQFHDAQSQHHESGFLFKEIAISCPTAAAKKAFDKFKMSTATQLK